LGSSLDKSNDGNLFFGEYITIILSKSTMNEKQQHANKTKNNK